ncbi:S41 family peptidase [Empedobacter sedimenti]|uniref:S41 family peptidase n=1 Tax=Empedobacter sedimenti TaxID=3042610 RepID=UPI0024A63336|nr:S41 family peptidase [Empedobacter sedimenti]
MRKIIFIALTILFASKIQAQNVQSDKQAIALNNEIFKIIKNNSLFTNELNWKNIETESKTLALVKNDSNNEQIIFDFYTNKLKEVGDKHSHFYSSKKINKIKESPLAEYPQGEYLGNGVGWIKVPRCANFDEKKDVEFANTIRSIIKKIDTENTIIGWIVDLRGNGGGSMWPMLAGLNALLEDGTTGYFLYGKIKIPWLNDNKNVNTYKIKNKKTKIAVLFDGNTGSSGEMTAVSFFGLPNVKSFGQKSAGYTTANNTYFLSNGGQLLLASAYIMDRNGKSYKDELTPDVIVSDLSNTKNDQVVNTAIKWLSE